MIFKLTNRQDSYKRSMLFSVLLWFVPIIVLNLGYIFINNLNSEIEQQEQNQDAQSQLQSMSATSDFAFQFAEYAGNFNSEFKKLTDTISIFLKKHEKERARKSIERHAQSIFKPPFPEYELLVFYMPSEFSNKIASSKEAKEFLIYSFPKINYGLSSIGQSFQYIVKAYENHNDKNQNSDSSTDNNENLKKMLNNFLKTPLIDVDVIATTQRGKPTYCLYKNHSHRFIWNYFKKEDNSSYGFFLFCKNDIAYENNGKKIAINKYNENEKSKKKVINNKVAFIPIIKGYGGPVYSDEYIENSTLFHNWIKKNIPNNDKDLSLWNYKNTPNGFKIGNFTGYSYIGKSQTHLSIVLVPNLTNYSNPIWLNTLTIIYLIIMIFIMLRGLLLNKWPDLKLKTRFTINYILACILPVSLLVITLYSYIKQYKQSKIFEGISNLQTCINEFDTRKNQLLEKYRSLFQSIVNNKQLIEALKSSEGTLSNKIPLILKKLFEEKTLELPVLSVTLFDEGGDGCSLNFDNNGKVADKATLILSKSHNKNEISDTKQLKVSIDQSITNMIAPISQTLREKKREAGYNLKESPIKITEQQDLLEQGFSTISGESLSDDLESRRGFINIQNLEGDEVFMRFHDFIKVDNKPFCTIIVRWNDRTLDEKTYKHTEATLNVRNPNFSYIAFRKTPEELEVIKTDSLRHINDKQKKQMKKMARDVSIIKCESKDTKDNNYYYAAPSKRYKDIIFVGTGNLDDISFPTNIRIIFCVIIIIITGLVIFVCNYISSRIFLEPIHGLKTALDEVINGKLNIEIIGNSQDEFGQLCHEFSMMTQGLRERNRLATLISDQAIEAIGSGEIGDFNTESFKGVVLVSDIRNFTSTCEKFPASLITEMLNEHFAEMTQIISSQGGRIYKYIGDAIEAVFPEDSRYSETAVKRAFNASSRMIIKLYQINKKRKKARLFTYKIGIGLRYGLLHSGTIGSIDTRMDYAILGEPLQTAAELESLSIKNPSFPLVVDEIVCNELTTNGLSFQPLPDSKIPAFILSDLGTNLSQPNLNKEQKNTTDSSNHKLENKSEIFRKIYAKSSISNTPYWLSFTLLFSFIAFIGISSYFGYIFSKQTKIEAYERIAYSANHRLEEQLKVNNIQRSAFENGCRKFFIEYEKLLNKEADEQDLNNCIEKYKDMMGFKRILVLKTEKRDNTSNYIIDETYKYNFSNNSIRALSISLFYKIDENLEKVFNDGMKKLRTTYCSTAFQAIVKDFGENPELEQEYIFWDYFYDHNCKTSGGLEGAIGCAIVTVSAEDFKSSMQKFVNCCSDDIESVHLAIKAVNKPKSEWICSNNFPKKIIEDYEKNKKINSNKFEITADTLLTINNEKYEVLITKTLPQKLNNYGKDAIIAFFIVLLIATYFLKKTLDGKSFINRSIVAKMWVNLLCIAIIPIITLIFVFELYLNEEENSSISRTQTELQNFATNFEYKATFLDLAGWKKIEEITYSPKIINAIAKTNKEKRKNNENKENENTTINSSYIRDVLKEDLDIQYIDRDYAHVPIKIGNSGILKNIPNPENFLVKDVVFAGSDWEVNSGIAENENSDNKKDKAIEQFSQMLGVMGKRQTQLIGSNTSINTINNVSGDYYAEMAIELIKNMFGTNLYIRLPHAFSIPTLFKITDMTIGVVVHTSSNKVPVPYTAIWMVIFDRAFVDLANEYNLNQSKNNSIYQKNLFSNKNETNFRIYPTDSMCFGTLKPDINITYAQHLKKLASQVSASGIAMSSRITSDKEDIFFEARPCIELPEYVTVSIAGTKHMVKTREHSKKLFYTALTISFLMILLIAWSIIFSILSPIRGLMEGIENIKKEQYSYRINILQNDEFGILCNSFDNMMKGLEEKQLMSKMISNTAQKVTLNEHENASQTAECALLYVSIPKFNSFIESMLPEKLLDNLKKQVTNIAKIILNEGGEIDKIIGDKQLIAFHANNRNIEECIYSACRAGLNLIKEESMGKMPFPIAIGIEYGYVVSGFVGVGNKRDFTVIGDPVNSSARIASFAETQSVERCLISENVYQLAKFKFGGKLIGEITLKGKAKPVKVYSLIKDNRIQS